MTTVQQNIHHHHHHHHHRQHQQHTLSPRNNSPPSSPIDFDEIHPAVLDGINGKKYKIIKVLSHGSFGVVYRVVDFRNPDGPHRALKIVNLETYRRLNIKDYFKECLREPMIMKKLNHPNICKVYEYWFSRSSEFLKQMGHHTFVPQMKTHKEDHPTHLCILMELAICSLEHLIKTGRENLQSYLRHIIHDLSNGIHELHRNGIIHLDLKTENVLLTNHGFVICDFGMSLIINQSIKVKGGYKKENIWQNQQTSFHDNQKNDTQKPRANLNTYMSKITPCTITYRPLENLIPKDIQSINTVSFSTDVWSFGVIILKICLPKMFDGCSQEGTQFMMNQYKHMCEPHSVNQLDSEEWWMNAVDPGEKSILSKFMLKTIAETHVRFLKTDIESISHLVKKNRMTVAASLCSSVAFLNILCACLRVDPNERPSAKELLEHPFITQDYCRTPMYRPSSSPYQ